MRFKQTGYPSNEYSGWNAHIMADAGGDVELGTNSGETFTETGDDYEETSFITETDDDNALNLPDVPLVPPPEVQQQFDTSGDSIQGLRHWVKQSALENQKKRLVDTFYKEVNRAHRLRPDRVDYNQFEIDDDGKTLYWTPGGGKRIRMTTTRGGFRFLALSSLSREYDGRGGANALRESLGLTEYQSGTPGLTESSEKTVLQADKEDLPGDTEDIELKELPGVANSADRSAEQVQTISCQMSRQITQRGPDESLLGYKRRRRETFWRLLHEDTTLAEHIRTLFREQGIFLPSHRFSRRSAWRSRRLCLRSRVVGEVRPPRHQLPSHPIKAVWRTG